MLRRAVRPLRSLATGRALSTSNVRCKSAYEGDGKTTVQVLNQDQELGLMIDSYATFGFRLNIGITVIGPMAIFPSTRNVRACMKRFMNIDEAKEICEDRTKVEVYSLCLTSGRQATVMSWQVRSSDEVTDVAFRLFSLIEPKIDLLVVGVETSDRRVLDTVRQAARSMHLNTELLPIKHACSTFNFLNAEGRSVAGAMIPPMSLVVNEDDMLQSQIFYQDVFNWENKKP